MPRRHITRPGAVSKAHYSGFPSRRGIRAAHQRNRTDLARRKHQL